MTSPTRVPSPTSSGLSQPVAVTLVRRGYRTPAEARVFLAAEESHPAEMFEGMDEVVGLILGAIEAGERITVHGDFDVDGVSATTLMISTLRDLGADCDWLIPDRIADGYGLSSENVVKLAERGTGLLITVDCGITAVEQVKAGAGAGDGSDRHRPPPARRGAAAVPDPAPGSLRLSVRVAVRDGGRLEAGLRAARRGRRSRDGRRQTSTWWRWRRSPTWSRWSARTGRW